MTTNVKSAAANADGGTSKLPVAAKPVCKKARRETAPSSFPDPFIRSGTCAWAAAGEGCAYRPLAGALVQMRDQIRPPSSGERSGAVRQADRAANHPSSQTIQGTLPVGHKAELRA